MPVRTLQLFDQMQQQGLQPWYHRHMGYQAANPLWSPGPVTVHAKCGMPKEGLAASGTEQQCCLLLEKVPPAP